MQTIKTVLGGWEESENNICMKQPLYIYYSVHHLCCLLINEPSIYRKELLKDEL